MQSESLSFFVLIFIETQATHFEGPKKRQIFLKGG
jgi:hypothetical protein